MDEESSALVMELAEDLNQFCDKMNPAWDYGFFRYYYERTYARSTGCYVVGSEANFLSGDRAPEIYDNLSRNGDALFVALGQEKGLFLLAVDADGRYNIKFDFKNLDRWEITKFDGGTGWPKDD